MRKGAMGLPSRPNTNENSFALVLVRTRRSTYHKKRKSWTCLAIARLTTGHRSMSGLAQNSYSAALF